LFRKAKKKSKRGAPAMRPLEEGIETGKGLVQKSTTERRDEKMGGSGMAHLPPVFREKKGAAKITSLGKGVSESFDVSKLISEGECGGLLTSTLRCAYAG
jgi:hypothetical protein